MYGLDLVARRFPTQPGTSSLLQRAESGIVIRESLAGPRAWRWSELSTDIGSEHRRKGPCASDGVVPRLKAALRRPASMGPSAWATCKVTGLVLLYCEWKLCKRQPTITQLFSKAASL